MDQLIVGRFAVASYLIIDRVSGKAIVVDPGAEPKRILARISERSASVEWIVCTHAHPDHVGAVSAVRKATSARFVMHREEERRAGRLMSRMLVRAMGGKPPPPVDRFAVEGESLPLGTAVFRVIHTPGHSPGGICLYTEGHLFAGDTVFVGGVGRTDLPGASWKALSQSIREKVLGLPDETRLWPGHDYGQAPSSLLGTERGTNPFLRQILAEG